MTARHAPRRRPRLRPLAKWLVGATLALVGVLAPIESPDLPGPLETLAGPRSALAQTGSVVPGSEDNCPQDPNDLRTAWQPNPNDPSQCVLLTAPCLPTPWDSHTYLQPSTQFPEFCELSVSSLDSTYTACTASTGVVVEDDGLVCRIIQNAICPSGVRVGFDTCRTIERRKWTCPMDSVPRNEFNTCYRALTTNILGTHPACGPGAPTLLILDCAEYVGDDFTAVPCSGFDPVRRPSTFGSVTNNYWCSYDSSLVDIDCHAPNPPCASAMALCLKRASQTGGCSVVSKTIACRVLQARFAAGTVELEVVRTANCEPCVILPFQPIPAACPEDLTDEPQQESRSRSRNAAFEAILTEEQDIRVGDSRCYRVSGGTIWPTHYPGGEPLADHPNCERLASICPNPSPGHLTWASSHFSQLAVVNSPVAITIHDIPTTYSGQDYVSRFGSALSTRLRTYAEYPEPDLAFTDNFMRLWEDVNNTVAYSSVANMANSSRECIIYYLPLFELKVRELWPDNPTDFLEIQDLFGADSLAWWNNIPTDDEKRRRTQAQGLEWWDDLNAAERTDRIAEMTQEINCDSSNDDLAWCRWQSAKPGYYKLTGFGAWVLNSSGIRTWVSSQTATSLNNVASGLSSGVRTRLLNRINGWGLTPEDLGFNSTLTAIIPLPAGRDPETLFTTRAFQARCPPLDVRVVCTYAGGTGNYVETEPIGVAVHEMRVSTVTPAR